MFYLLKFENHYILRNLISLYFLEFKNCERKEHIADQPREYELLGLAQWFFKPPLTSDNTSGSISVEALLSKYIPGSPV